LPYSAYFLPNRFWVKRLQTFVDAVSFNDTVDILTVRYFKKPTEFADPIYKSYIINVPKDSTFLVILTEKSVALFDKKADNHMLCGWRGSAHLNFGTITTDGEVKYADYKKRVLGIVANKLTPVASSYKGEPAKKED
jgi:hypothetical protein